MSNQSIYEKNIESLKKDYTDICEGIKECGDEHVILDKSVHDEDIFAIEKNNRLYYLNSRYNDDEFAETWVEQYKGVNYQAVFIIFGLSNFTHVKKLLEITELTNPILLYEPDKEIFKKSIQTVDITEIVETDNVLLCVRELNDNYLTEFILFALNYAKIGLVNYCCMPNYDNLYLTEWRNLVKDIKSRFESLIMSRNTLIAFSKEFIINMLHNCEDMINQYSANQLKDEAQKIENIEQIPAILVSAGPSLDKNIEDLKQAVGKSVIIAVDTALKTLVKHKIKPDIVVTVDSHKPPVLFMCSEFSDIPMLVCSNSNKELWTIHSGKRFYFDEPNSYMSYLHKTIKGKGIQPLETGGSVANNAFSAIHVLGFKKIIMVGQDLAYPNNRMHTDDAYGGTEEVDNRKQYFEVEDVFGGMVTTESNMDLYRKWFEDQIVRYKDLKVIDATEGGAKIAGTEIITLKEAISRECKTPIQFKEIIDKIPPLFNEEEREILKNKIAALPEELDKAEKKIRQGIRNYEKMEELYRKGKIAAKEFKNLANKTEKIIKYLEEDSVMHLVAVCNQAAEHELLSRVYQVKEDLKDEIRDITTQGIKMMNSYIEGIKSLRSDFEGKDKVQKEDIQVLIEKLKEQIKGIAEFTEKQNVEKVNEWIKDYYKYAVELINKLIMDKTGCEENYHERLLDVLNGIVKDYENGEYSEMALKMENEFLNILNMIAG